MSKLRLATKVQCGISCRTLIQPLWTQWFQWSPNVSSRSEKLIKRPSFTCRSLTGMAETEKGVSSDSLDLISHLEQRGLIESCSGIQALREKLQKQSIRLYCGFDPTSDCLHLGNLMAIIVLLWFQRYGHSPVALIGGATGRVGDPSGKQSERPLLSESQLQHNTDAIGVLLQKLFERNGTNGFILNVVNNLDWFGKMSLLEFLREIGKNARLGTMLSKESVKSRMSSDVGMSFTEFSYQLLQGYDFYHLCRSEGLVLQIGGSDQWGNITAGIDLAKRLWPSNQEPPELHALTFPLLVDNEGKKFGKSEGGAIWLSAEKLSPYKFYQYLFSTTDADVIRFMKLLTFLSLDEIQAIENTMKGTEETDYVPNTAQRKLAEEVTRLVHGEEGLKQALSATEALRPGSETKLDAETLSNAAEDAPTVSVHRSDILDVFLTDVLVNVKLQESKSAAKKMIRNGGIRVNNQKIEDIGAKLSREDLVDDRMVLLSAGKKNKLLLKVLNSPNIDAS